MPDQTASKDKEPSSPIPGLDAEATPLLGIGLGLTGLALGLRPRLAPLPLALTALAAALYRNPRRATPQEQQTLFAPADGAILAIEEVYEHRFLHTDCLRIAIAATPLDVPVTRSPAAGVLRYREHVSGEYRPVGDPLAAERNERLYLGISAEWGPLLVVLIASPLGRRIACRLQPGDPIAAGDRLATVRFGARTDLYIQRDSFHLQVEPGQRLAAGLTRIGERSL